MQLLNTLYVMQPETYLNLENETLRVTVDRELKVRVPLHHLQTVVCFGHIALSTPLMHQLAERGIALVLLDDNGRFKARVEGPMAGNVLLRRAQHAASGDIIATIELARACVAGKIRNARTVLQRAARDAKSPDDAATLARGSDNLAASLRSLPVASDLDVVRGIEGEAARQYFGCMTVMVRSEQRPHFAMTGRTRRPPLDRINALLSFLYALWMNDCRSALETVGLDPQVGFLHALRPGRAALALDLMEEFRPIADRLALTLINRSQLRERDFDVREGGAVGLRPEPRKEVLVAFQERKKESVPHPLLKEAVPLGLIPMIQARLMARSIRSASDPGQGPVGYLPFLLRQ